MNILKKLGKIIPQAPTRADRAVYLYVQCDRCGEKLRARVDSWNELTPEYDGKSDDPTSYFCRKVLIGEKQCYQPIELRLRFDKSHKLVSQEIQGGKFIDQKEYTPKD
jgi:hypothetical protein